MYNNVNIPNTARREDPCRPLVADLQGMFQKLAPPLTNQCCIYRVPWRLRKLNESAYTPCAISIGPFHHGRPELQFMEKRKERYLSDYLQHARLSLDELVKNAKNWEPSVRLSYAETINLNDRELMKMILMDGCFIIEYFSRTHNTSWKDQNDLVLFKPWLDNYIVRDLILLENQIPFSILQLLYDLAFVNRPNVKPFTSFDGLAFHFLKFFNTQGLEDSPRATVLHFTDLVRAFHLPHVVVSDENPTPVSRAQDRKQVSCSATMLHAAGVRFKVSSSNRLFDIGFTPRKGELELPHLDIDDRTNSLMRNLMAFEQCHYPFKTMICNYILLMDSLVNTTEDVDLLVRKGVLTNSLGAHDVVATLFNNLGREIIQYPEKSFVRLADDLSEYYNKPWNRWKSSLKREYLNTPWKIASIVAAITLLVLTAMQTVGSYLAWRKSRI